MNKVENDTDVINLIILVPKTTLFTTIFDLYIYFKDKCKTEQTREGVIIMHHNTNNEYIVECVVCCVVALCYILLNSDI